MTVAALEEHYVSEQQAIPASEAAELLGISRGSFYHLARTGQVRATSSGYGRRYRLADVLAIKARKEAGKPRKVYRKRAPHVLFDWLAPTDIPAILKLDYAVYHEMYLAEAQVYQQWSEKNPQLALCAFDAQSGRETMLAYVAALPVEESVILSILRGEREEISLTKEEIQSYERPGAYTLLANSAVVHPDHPELLRGVIRGMVQAWVDRYPERYVTKVYAQAVSRSGDMLIQGLYMAPLYHVAKNAYVLDLARPAKARLLRQFQEQLAAKAPLPDALRQPYEEESA